MPEHTGIFEKYRPELFRLAYGMLGRVAPAEDAVQEAFLRWQKQDIGGILSPRAWLSKVVNRICLDEIKSAYNRREQYIGTDLPEPLLAEKSNTPEQALELAESLSMALLVVLDSLTPVQRAVFLLREVFDYDYASIASILDKPEATCRKIAQRARSLVSGKRPRFGRNITGRHEVLRKFTQAIVNRDMQGIERMLAEDAIMYSDGGGKVRAMRKPIYGPVKIAKFLLGIQKGVRLTYSVEFREVNGEPGIIFRAGDEVRNVWSFHIENGRIRSIYVVLNPDKLEHIK